MDLIKNLFSTRIKKNRSIQALNRSLFYAANLVQFHKCRIFNGMLFQISWKCQQHPEENFNAKEFRIEMKLILFIVQSQDY